MTKIKEQFASYLTKIGFEDGKVASLFNEDGTELTKEGLDAIIKHDAARVQKLKDAGTKLFDDGHKKGSSEAYEKLEKQIQEKFGVKSEKQGVELIEEIIASKTSSTTEIDEAKVKLHPAYVALQDEMSKKVKAVEKEWKARHEEFEKSIHRENLFKEVTNKAKEIVVGLKPILPSDKTKAEKQLEWFINEVKSFDFNKTEDGKDFIVSKDGKVLEDNHGNRINFETLVKSKAESIFDFQQGNERTGAGNNNDDNAGNAANGQAALKVKKPANDTEYIQAINQAKTPEEKIAITDAYYSTESN